MDVSSAGDGRTMHKPHWTARGSVLLMVVAVAVAQHLTPVDRTLWHYIFPRLYYIPIVLAALRYGWRGGLVFALLSALAFFPQFLYGSELDAERLIHRYLEVIAFCTLAVLTGVYTDRERRQKQKYQEVAAKLADVYQTLQQNFEGMKRAERLSAIGHLSAGLAHEIRNPLASIAGAAAIVRRSQPTDTKVSRCIDIIEAECSRLNGMLTNFLTFARPRPPRFQLANLDTLLSEVIELAEHAVNRRAINFRKEVSEIVSDIDCDPEQLRQVLLNLLINAVEASEEGATVSLFAGLEGEAIIIRVVDEGSGVAPEDVDKLFDPFFTTKETGTGLGLPVAHQIIAQMGGNLTARRNAGRGMTFSVILPLMKRVARQ